IGTKGRGMDSAFVLEGRADWLARGRVPKLDHAHNPWRAVLPRARRQSDPAVRAGGACMDVYWGPKRAKDWLTCTGMPELGGLSLIVGGGSKLQFAVWAEGDGPDFCAVSKRRTDRSASVHVPESSRRIKTGRGDGPAVWTESHRTDAS